MVQNYPCSSNKSKWTDKLCIKNATYSFEVEIPIFIAFICVLHVKLRALCSGYSSNGRDIIEEAVQTDKSRTIFYEGLLFKFTTY